jgi:hypothetical protein
MPNSLNLAQILRLNQSTEKFFLNTLIYYNTLLAFVLSSRTRLRKILTTLNQKTDSEIIHFGRYMADSPQYFNCLPSRRLWLLEPLKDSNSYGHGSTFCRSVAGTLRYFDRSTVSTRGIIRILCIFFLCDFDKIPITLF